MRSKSSIVAGYYEPDAGLTLQWAWPRIQTSLRPLRREVMTPFDATDEVYELKPEEMDAVSGGINPQPLPPRPPGDI